ncbi:unnamed protein product [Brachionus calyciflorus]|uniref:Peptidase S1 domain-containing protein n=1 Tax=Brachionus calyciflorus TaxID=104777 RepID=A0A814BTF2_9BILA|nr:unnamed protein product [Brachionus calyciflorus]
MLLRIYIIYIIVKLSEAQTCPNSFTPPFCDECGLSSVAPNVRIVGGTEANPNSWPSIAFVEFTYKYDFNMITYTVTSRCGGTLINRDTIVTAAHCYLSTINRSDGSKIRVIPNKYFQTIESMYTVYLGLHDVRNRQFQFSVNSFTQHPNYRGGTENDIAIIRLRSTVTYNSLIQPGCLPYGKASVYPTTFNIDSWAAGWGTLSFKGPLANTLQNVRLTIVSGGSNSIIYAGDFNGGKDTCQGDSGGPLFIKDSFDGSQKYILVGITSFGVGCGTPGKYGGYTRVSAFLNWITETANADKSTLMNGNTYNHGLKINISLFLNFTSLTIFVIFTFLFNC